MRILTELRDRTPPSIRHHARRGAVTCAVVAGHALLIFLLCAHAPAPPPGDAGADGTVILASLVAGVPETLSPPARSAHAKPAAKRPAVTPTHTPEASPSPDATRDVPDAAPPSPDADADQPQLSDADAQALDQFQMASAAGASDQPCNLTAMLTTVFANSPEVKQGLDELPASQRSVANAVMLWDGQWPEESLSGGKALLRALLIKAVASARPDCLTRANSGPVLFFVPDDKATVVVAVGSGDWRWGDLLPRNVADRPVLLQAGNYFQSLTSEIGMNP